MRTTILIVFAVLILVCVPAMAAGDHVELYNIGVTVSMEDEQTTISLFLDGMIEPRKIDTEEESILIFDLPDVELTAADEGGTSFMVFSPSVASIKLTQLATDPFVTRLEIYTNDLREFAIETHGSLRSCSPAPTAIGEEQAKRRRHGFQQRKFAGPLFAVVVQHKGDLLDC